MLRGSKLQRGGAFTRPRIVLQSSQGLNERGSAAPSSVAPVAFVLEPAISLLCRLSFTRQALSPLVEWLPTRVACQWCLGPQQRSGLTKASPARLAPGVDRPVRGNRRGSLRLRSAAQCRPRDDDGEVASGCGAAEAGSGIDGDGPCLARQRPWSLVAWR